MQPVKYHLDQDLRPDKATRMQLENVAADQEIFSHVAVMPDVHSKFGRKCPTGTVVATKNDILPQVMDTAPNCGMRLMTTPFYGDDLRENLIDELFSALVKSVPTRTYLGDYISKETALNICREGLGGLLDYLQEDRSELDRVLKGGNFFDTPPTENEIKDVVPDIFLRAAQWRLGILGEAGNHFLDLMKIEQVMDQEKADLLGVKQDQYVFLMHTGSGIFGQYLSYFFTPKKEEHLSMKIITNLGRMTFNSELMSKGEIRRLQREVKEFREKKEFFHIDPRTKRGRAYLTAHRAGANFGFANRQMIKHNMEQTLKQVFNKKIKLETVYDTGHVHVDREQHYGQELWVHRNGATRGFGPSRMKDHFVFSKTGEPGFIAGSMSTPSYLVCGRDDNESTFYSINHGAGRARKIKEGAPENKEELARQMEESQVKLYNARSKGVVQQASKYYKDVEQIIRTADKYKIARPVASLKPVAVLMA